MTLYAHDAKMSAITAHYTSILGCSDDTTWAFDLAQLYDGMPKADGGALIAPFDAVETWRAVRAMKADSAPGPDGIGPGFYRAAWGAVGADVMTFLHDFHAGNVDLQRINRAHIVLIPKCPDKGSSLVTVN